MAVPLVQLLATVPDQEIRVAAGVNGLQNPIRWVHMVEGVEISSFLEGGELAFITGIALNEDCTLERLIHQIQLHGAGVYAGTGRVTKSVRCLAASYHLAQKVLNLQKKRQTLAEPAFYEDLGVYRLLMSVEDQELREYTAAILGPLQTADATGGTTYMDFLRIWLGCGCSTQRTAEQLFLHRNTVEYHLHRIGALLHMDMSELNVRLQLSLALKILDMG